MCKRNINTQDCNWPITSTDNHHEEIICASGYFQAEFILYHKVSPTLILYDPRYRKNNDKRQSFRDRVSYVSIVTCLSRRVSHSSSINHLSRQRLPQKKIYMLATLVHRVVRPRTWNLQLQNSRKLWQLIQLCIVQT